MNNPIGIFLIGGPGSGKDYVLNNIFSRFNLIEVQVEHLLNGSANELLEQNKNIVINGALDEEKIAAVCSLLEGYNTDYIYVSVTNKVSRLRNSLRDNPLAETKRTEKWLSAEKLAKRVECFTFNNSINLNESSELEKIFFADQIEKLLSRLLESGLELQEASKAKTFVPVPKHKAGLPKKYVAGLSDKTAAARKAHWKKMSKYSDRDPRAYKPAPGDATAKTKLSKYTKKYHAMYGESVEAELKTPHTPENIAKKHNVDVDVILKALEAGKKIEKEHTNDEYAAQVIALAHLWEKPDYYKLLAKVEQVAVVTSPEDHVKHEKQLERERRIRDTRYIHHQNRHIHQAAKGSMSEAEDKPLPVKLRRAPRSGNITAVMDKRKETGRINEGAADTSLAAKAKKSGISLGTLRKVYNRGVAAWNSGHRPGTTPQQWGHARVNSYITKGKTYHTADKDLREDVEQIDELDQKTLKLYINKSIKTGRADDSKGAHNLYKATSKVARNQATSTLKKKVSNLRYTPIAKHKNPFEYEASRDELGNRKVSEEADINELFEMQLVGTDEYRKHAIAMTPGQGEPVDAFPVKSPNKKPIAVPAKKGESIVSQYTEHTECGTPNCCGECNKNVAEAGGDNFYEERENDGKEDGVDFTPEVKPSKLKKGMRTPGNMRFSYLDGLPVTTARVTEAQTLDTSTMSAPPGHDYKNPYAKPLSKIRKDFMPTPRQVSPPPGGHPVPKGYKRVPDNIAGWKLVKEDNAPELTLEEAVKYHIENKISFTENVFRPGSDLFFQMIGEAKKLYSEGEYEPKDEWEQDMLASDIGEKAIYEGQEVILDYPFEEELNEADDPTNGKGIGKPWQEGGGGAVYVKVGDSVRKISFSKSGMKKKYMDPAATRSFVARHHCLTNKDKTSASYWACRWPRFFSNSGKIWW